MLQIMFLKYYLDNNTIEIIQSNSNKPFLKRVYYPDIQLKDLFIGNSITVYSRLFTITKYANKSSELYFKSKETHFLFIVDTVDDLLVIFRISEKYSLTLGSTKTISGNYNFDTENITVKNGNTLIEFVGLNDKSTYENYMNEILRSTSSKVQVYSALLPERISEIIKQCKPVKLQKFSTFCLIKPHIVKSKVVGNVLKSINDNRNFTISGIMSIHLTLTIADELFDVYRTAVTHYRDMIDQIVSGPSIALLITPSNSNDNPEYIVHDFRDFCGPVYPEIAQVLRPTSLRSLYGISHIQNGFHCTDLSEDGELECKYVFETLGSI